jgi:5-methylcytosine-specific restriction endonuclease McrA
MLCVGWDRRNKPRARQGKKLPKALRDKVLRDADGCWFKYPSLCTGLDGKLEVHHVVEVEDGGTDDEDNLVAACKPCHTRFSAQQSQRRAVAAANDWKRRPEKHPGVLD